MSRSRLTRLQHEVLAALAPIEPRWTLTGGGALAGVHLGHRMTRDLDLFWHGRSVLGDLADGVVSALRAKGLTAQSMHRADGFHRFHVADAQETVIVDLVAEPVPFVEAPVMVELNGVRIQVDTPHEILVNKLCAVLGRAEVRDLVDLRELLRTGGDLERAMRDAPRKDGGFSPLMVAWLLAIWRSQRWPRVRN